MKTTSLCYIEENGCWLMLYRNKKAQDDNKGYYIGIGGKCEPGEAIDDCMLRETKEETGLSLTEYRRRGLIHFRSDRYPDEEMYLYTASAYTGTLTKECAEGELSWIPKEDVLSLHIWEGDAYFLKRLLRDDAYFEMTLLYRGDKLDRVIYEDGSELLAKTTGY